MTMTMNDLYEKQLSIEAFYSTEAVSNALSKFFNNISKGTEMNTKYGQEALFSMVPAIIDHFLMLVDKPGQHKNEYWYLLLRPMIQENENNFVAKLADIVALNIVSTLSQRTPMTTVVAGMADASFNLMKTDFDLRKKYVELAMKFFMGIIQGPVIESCEVVRIEEYTKERVYVTCAPHLTTFIQEEAANIKASSFSYVPMVYPPVDHKNLISSDGGFLSMKSPLLKLPTKVNGKIHKALLRFNDKSNPDFFKTLNKAQRTPYQVNRALYDVLHKHFQEGDFFKSFPLKYAQVEETCMIEAKANIVKLHDILDTVKTKLKCEQIEKSKGKGMEMARKTQDIMGQAETFYQYDNLYFPLFLDDRQRRYTWTPTSSLTYMGTELAKALLIFAEKEKYTEEGLKAAYQTLGNALGFDKSSIVTKENFAREWFAAHLADFMGDDWSYFFTNQDEFEEPVTALAICIDLTMYHKDPDHLSGFCHHRDARCSGPSIVGTLLKDKQAMTLTSVIDEVKDTEGKLPDAYTYVAETGRKLNTNKYFEEHHEVLFSRKTWKTPTMTRGSYGCSQHTIHKGKMKKGEYLPTSGNLFVFNSNNLDASKANAFTILMMKTLDVSLPSCSLYLDAIKAAVKQYVEKHDCYHVVSPITGFPMVRRKCKEKERRLESPGTYKRIQLVIHTYTDELDKKKMLSACGPDTIHFVDSSILFRVQELCDFPIATVHDSIAASGNNVTKVVQAYAQAAYELAKNDVIGQIFKQLNAEAPYVNDITDEELEDVKNSRHILA